MKATPFEFRHRSILNLIQFWIAFQLYSFDHINVVWAFVPWDTPRGAMWARLVFGFATLLLAFAAGIRTWAAAYLRAAVVHDTDLHTEKLVADGPYRHVRNPLYLGTFLMSVGLGFLASRAGFVILVAGAAIRITRLIGREEAELVNQQGERYLEFCRRVPSFIPSLSPRVPASGQKPEWGQAFRGEAAMWGFLVTMAAFALTLRDNIAWFLGGATLLVWLGRNIAVRLNKAPESKTSR
jgi:protein-S-isoprenylcysteine O-methyltransferase Ste14